MRYTSKTLIGGVLAALLVLSASPAQAFDPQDPEVGTEQEAPATEVPEVDVESEPESPVDEEPAEGTDPEAVIEESVDPVDTADEAVVAEVDETKTVTVAPSTIAVSGRLLVLPTEPNSNNPTGDESLISGALLVTENGAYVPVDISAVLDPVTGGAQFTGTATVPETARAAVTAQIVSDGALSQAEVLDTINESILEDDVELPVTGSVQLPAQDFSEAPMGAAPAKRTHTADVMFFTSGRNFNDTWIKNLVTQTGSYWKTQSDGAVAGLSVARYKRASPKYYECSQNSLWNQAASSFGANGNTYTNGHHLIVFVDSSNGCGGLAGLAGIGSKIHDGGVIWVDIRGWAPTGGATEAAVNLSKSTLAHELGHNLSLGHSQSRVCSGRTIDARTAWKDDEQNPGILRVLKPSGTACKDVEYGNTWDLMGHTNSAGAKPVALGLAQRSALGVNPSGSVRTVQASGGRVQNFTLNPLGNGSGLRGLKITNPRGESFYVEYRNNVGQDSAGPGTNMVTSADGVTAVTSGVVLSKSYPTAMNKWTDGVWRPYPAKRSTALTTYKTSGSFANRKHLTMLNGAVSTPVSSVARVRVTSVAGGKANVRVEFTPFTDVTYDHKFGKEINWMSSSKLSTGINAGNGLRKYEPKGNVTREAMAAFLYRLNTPAGATGPAGYKIPKTSPFKDVPKNHKFYKEIAWMSTSGLSTGIKSGKGKIYAPKAGVTREAMSAFLYRMDKNAKPSPLAKSPFVDMTPRTKFYKEISWMYQKGLSTGVSKNGKRYYQPKNTVTREAMAAFIYRYKH